MGHKAVLEPVRRYYPHETVVGADDAVVHRDSDGRGGVRPSRRRLFSNDIGDFLAYGFCFGHT